MQRFNLKPLAIVIVLALRLPVVSAENHFNPLFLSDDPAAVADLSTFEKNGNQLPGTYRVDIYLNEQFVASKDVKFTAPGSQASADKAGNGLQACLTEKNLIALGINIQAIQALVQHPPKEDACLDLMSLVPDASTELDFERQRLAISVPQAVMNNKARGYIPPEQWDQGIPALLLNYNFTGSNTGGGSDSASNSYFLNLSSGANLGPWRLRDVSTWNYSSGDGHRNDDWRHISTYVERTIIPIKGELVLGDSYTPNDLFDSLSVRGIQLISDDNMLPDSLKGFAPTIRGIAKGNAKVTIKQSGYVVDQRYVPPGAFEINDLYPTSSSGDLVVTVTEADGSESNFTVPYSSVPILQREGRFKYALIGGKFRPGSDSQQEKNYGELTGIYGLAHGVTTYGGLQIGEDYKAIALGMGFNMGPVGAISFDATQANSILPDDSHHQGQSYRFLYAKSLNDLGTNFQLIGYRYSTSGFYTFDQTTYKQMRGYNTSEQNDDQQDGVDWTDYYNLYYAKKGKIQVNISQQVGTVGSLFLTGTQQSYWHTSEKDTTLQVGFNTTFKDVNYGLSYSFNQSAGGHEDDHMFALTVSLPIGKWLSSRTDDIQPHNDAYATYTANTDNHGNVNQNAGLSGTLLKGNNLSYSVMQGYANKGNGNSGSASLNYQGTYGNSSVGYNYSGNGDYQQVNYGLNGGVVIHQNGVTLSQPLGDTNVLIAAPGANGVGVENGTGIKTDWRGYAVVPYSMTYHSNRIALNTNTLGNNVDIDDAVVEVVPTQGALVRAQFKASVGVRALLNLMKNGKPVPFGAMVSREGVENAGIVGDEGQVYLSGLPLSGVLKAVWGAGADQQCTAKYVLPEDSLSKAIVKAKVICQ